MGHCVVTPAPRRALVPDLLGFLQGVAAARRRHNRGAASDCLLQKGEEGVYIGCGSDGGKQVCVCAVRACVWQAAYGSRPIMVA